MAAARPCTILADGLKLVVRLTPKGGGDAIEGIEHLSDGSVVLKARVRAAPHEGEANEALCKLLAKALGTAPSRVRLTSGATARIKTLTVQGDGAQHAATLEKLAGEPVV